MIRVNREGDRVEFTRTAVGKHLLLGGDNLDLTLTWLVESKLGRTLVPPAAQRICGVNAPRRRNGCWPTRTLEKVEITVLGAGTGLVGGTLRTEITREEVLELTLEGFLPFCDLDDKPKEEKTQPFPRARPALRFRSRRNAASGGVPEQRRTRSPTPFCSTAASSSPISAATASPM